MNTLKNFLALAALLPLGLSAQDRFATKTGRITFFSETAVENIEATNDKVMSVLDATSGAVEFSLLIKGFAFEKALMQEHFNENYMESNTYPKALFKGKMSGLSADALKKPGTYDVTVAGDLTIHGVTKPVTHKGKVTVNADGSLKADSEFMVKPEDHNISVPGVVRKNIAEQIKVTVAMAYQKM
jgi:polyisoprenoid-binding protein YceI